MSFKNCTYGLKKTTQNALVYDRKYAVIPVSAFEQDSLNVLKMERQQIRSMKNATAAMRKHLSRFQGIERKVKLEELGNITALE